MMYQPQKQVSELEKQSHNKAIMASAGMSLSILRVCSSVMAR